jgi:hypothetical protein
MSRHSSTIDTPAVQVDRRGFLTGEIHAESRFDYPGYTDYRLTNPRFTPEALAAIEIHGGRLRKGLLELSDVEAPPKA